LSVKRLLTAERLSLVRLAQEKSVSFAARRFDVNRKTVYYWLKISRNDGITDENSSKIISVSQKKQILRFAKENGISTIEEFIRRYKIRYSFTAIYNILASSKVPAKSPKILIYSCSGCNKRFEALAIYIGTPTTPPCPTCGRKLKIVQRRKVYFLGSIDNYLLAHGLKLKKVTGEDVSIIRRSCRPPDSYFPKYADSVDKEESEITHIESETSSESLKCLCGTHLNKHRGVIYSALSGTLNLDRICSECVDEANDLLRKGIKLEPNFKFIKRSKSDAIEDAIALGETTRNISQACKFYRVSRTSYYKYRKRKSLPRENKGSSIETEATSICGSLRQGKI